jgi:chorismate mutase
MPVKLFRAGVWKPRTRPGAFEGAGEKALPWLKEMKEIHGLRWTVEVAEPGHLEAALNHGVDAVWIGARTTVNPFAVQRLADALRGVKIPVLVKNPVNPDVELWLGAIERVERAGITDVAAIHRGFSSYKSSSPYRNAPTWAVPIELRRRRPDLFVVCDPSHIAGKQSLVPEVAQKAHGHGL